MYIDCQTEEKGKVMKELLFKKGISKNAKIIYLIKGNAFI